MTTSRPSPDSVSTSLVLTRWYWTRAELDTIARRVGVPRTGNKQQLTERLVAHFDGAPLPQTAGRKRAEHPLRPPFSPDMVVPAGQPMTRELRAYLTQQIGPQFRFDGFMREFFADPGGRTLTDAVAHWKRTRGLRRPIEAQFEYNRFTADFRRDHPGASRAEILAAWHDKKATARF